MRRRDVLLKGMGAVALAAPAIRCLSITMFSWRSRCNARNVRMFPLGIRAGEMQCAALVEQDRKIPGATTIVTAIMV